MCVVGGYLYEEELAMLPVVTALLHRGGDSNEDATKNWDSKRDRRFNAPSFDNKTLALSSSSSSSFFTTQRCFIGGITVGLALVTPSFLHCL